jgi:hypothetical protein
MRLTHYRPPLHKSSGEMVAAWPKLPPAARQALLATLAALGG